MKYFYPMCKTCILQFAFILQTFVYCSFTSAASDEKPESSSFQLREITVISGSAINQTLFDTPISLAHLEQELDSIQAEHANEVFISTANTWISRGDGQEHLTAIRSPVFTGPGSCGNFYIAEDGIAVRAAGFCNANQVLETFYENANAIEVFRGPHSSVFGANALFGGINVITPQRNHDSNLSVSAGSFDKYQFNWQTHFGNTSFFGNANSSNSAREKAGFKQNKFGFKNYVDLSDWQISNSLTVMQHSQNTAGFIEGEDSYFSKQAREANPTPDAYRDIESLRAYSRWSLEQAHSELIITPYARYNNMEFLMHFVPWQPVEKNGHYSFGVQNRYISYISREFSFSLGLDAELSSGFLEEEQFGDAPFAQDRFPRGVHYDFDVDALSTALFSQFNYQFLPNYSLHGSLRYDYVSYDYKNNVAQGFACSPGTLGCRFYRPESREDSFAKPSLRLSIQRTIGSNLRVFLNAARAFRAPQANELYRLQAEQENQAIEAPTLTSAETGMRFDFENTFAAVTFFSMTQRDGIYQNNDREYLTGLSTTHEGVEYELGYSPLANLKFNIAGSYARHQYRNDPTILSVNAMIKENIIDTAPQHMLTSSVDWQINKELGFYLRVHKLGEYFLDPENAHIYAGHTLADAQIKYLLNKNWQFLLSIKNLFDRHYAERADFAFGEYRYFPGLPRRATITTRLAF